MGDRLPRLALVVLMAVGILALLIGWPLRAAAVSAPAPALQIEALNAHTLRLTLTVDRWQIDEALIDGARYSTLTVAGATATDAAGLPRVPVTGTLLGVPTTQGVQVRVVRAEPLRVALPYPLAPSPTAVLHADAPGTMPFNLPDASWRTQPDPAVYRQTSAYPAAPAALGFTGILRGQPVAQVALHPVQYYPAAQAVEIYRTLVVDVTWPATARAPLAARSVSPAYERMLQASLANYDQLARPLALPAASKPAATRAVSTTSFAPLKLLVETSGLYRVTRDDLIAAGWDVSALDPRNLQLTQRGAPIALQISGEADGALDPGDTLLFYGEAYHDLYVAENIYWLHVGATPGTRIAQRDELPPAAFTLDTFPATLHLEQDSYYWNTLTYAAPDEDFWFWGNQLAPAASGLDSSRSVTFTLNALPAEPYSATLRVYLKGRTSGSHASRLILNGHDLGQRSFNGTARTTHSVTFDQSVLQTGVNTLQIQAVNTGNIISQWHLNWVQLDWQALPLATADELTLNQTLATSATVTLDGFSGAPALFDISQPAAPVAVALPTRAVSVTATLSTGVYFAAPDSAQRAPAAIVPASPAVWQDPADGADYIVITHANFITAAQRLADHRATQGLRTIVVDVQAIYDHFDAGFATPDAIRNFLRHAYQTWTAPAPTYVVLIGDGNQDYKLLLGGEDTGFIPPRMINTNDYGQVPSDNWYVAFEGNDVLPELLIGRISVASPAQAERVVGTIIDYDANPQSAGRVLLVADDEEAVFENTSTLLAAKVPYPWAVDRIDVGDYTTPTVIADIGAAVVANPTMINYTGHGNHFRWGSYRLNRTWYRILTANDLPPLAPANVTPFWTVLNCLNGFFSIPPAVAGPESQLSFAEAAQHNAAVAIWADSALGYSSGQLLITGHFYDTLFRDGNMALGAATTEAKLRTVAAAPFWTRMVETFVLFGDPVTTLNAPTPPHVTQTTPPTNAAGVAVDAPVVVRFNKRMDPASVVLTDTHGTLYSASWNALQTEATFTHTRWPGGATIQLFVGGQDLQGQLLQAGPQASTEWAFSTAVPTATTLRDSQTVTARPALLWLLLLAGLSAVLLTARRRKRIG